MRRSDRDRTRRLRAGFADRVQPRACCCADDDRVRGVIREEFLAGLEQHFDESVFPVCASGVGGIYCMCRDGDDRSVAGVGAAALK